MAVLLHLIKGRPLFFLLALALTTAVDRLRSSDLWCVAKNNAEDAVLQGALDWACGPGSADCKPVQEGGACFEPDDLQSHASYAFNDYFRRQGSSPSSCDFSGAAAITGLNPSHGNCKFPASNSYVSNGSFIGSSVSSGTRQSVSHWMLVLAALFMAGRAFR